LIGWTQTGNTTVLDSSTAVSPLGVDPISPTHEALLSTVFSANPALGLATATALENFLLLPLGTLSNLGNGPALQGSAISQSFHADAGSTLTLYYDFASQEQQTPTVSRNDFAFVSITPASSGSGASTLPGASVATATFNPLPVGSQAAASFVKDIGWQTFSYTFTTSGTYQLGLGIIDQGSSHLGNSGLYVDSVALTAVPEPKAWTIIAGLGLCGVALAHRVRISKHFAA
jgi:hypothetical protein